MKLQRMDRRATLDQWETQQYRTDAPSRQRTIGELARRAADKQPWLLTFADGESAVIGSEGVQQRSAGLSPPTSQPAARRGARGGPKKLTILFLLILIAVNATRFNTITQRHEAAVVAAVAIATPKPSTAGIIHYGTQEEVARYEAEVNPLVQWLLAFVFDPVAWLFLFIIVVRARPRKTPMPTPKPQP